MGYVTLGHDQIVIVADGPLGHSDVKVLRLTPHDKVPVDASIFKAKPAVFVLLNSDTLHFEVDFQ